MEFLKVDTVENAQQKIAEIIKTFTRTIEVDINDALGKILAVDLHVEDNVPNFRRSTVDGYAVKFKDTLSATESIPTFLTIKGCAEMGKRCDIEIKSGECVEMPTGAMIPDTADAVVMVEYCENLSENEVAMYRSVAQGENVVQIGEDMVKGELLLKKGQKLSAPEIGALAAAGITTVEVYDKITISIISTGDELIDPKQKGALGKIRDVNTYLIAGLAEKNDYAVVQKNVINDDEIQLGTVISQAMKTSDIVAISGGSSKGKKDITAKMIDQFATPGVFLHGLAIKPGKPTILGHDEKSKTLLVGLPGHPVSAMVVFELLFGKKDKKPIPATLSVNVPSAEGKLTFYPCILTDDYEVMPIFSKSGLITALTKADGYFLIERDKEGLQKGERVMVYSFE